MIKMVSQGAMIAVAVITAFYLGLKNGGAAMASTMAFSTLTLARLFHGFNCRGKQFIFKMGFTTNPYSIYAFATGAAFLGLVIFIPGLHGLFQIQTMPVTAMILSLIHISQGKISAACGIYFSGVHQRAGCLR